MRARTAVSLAALAALSLTTPALAAGVATAAPATPAAPATAAADVTAPAGFTGMVPTRVLDTRDFNKVPATRTARPLQAGEYFSTPLATGCHSHPPQECYSVVPADVTAVVVNVTATNPTTDGFLSIGSVPGQPGTRPATSSINFKAGQTVSNLVTVAVGPVSRTSPWITVYNNWGTTDVVLDVVGYYRPGATDRYGPLNPTRIADSRTDGTGRLGGDAVRTYQVRRPELGTANATSVILNVTATDGTWDSYLTAYPSGSPRPASGSNVNFPVGRTVANQVVVPVGADGKIDIYNHAGWAHVIVDVVGSYGPDGQGLFSALRTPVRIRDSREAGGKLLPLSTTDLQAVPTDGSVPNAMGVEANLTVTDADESGYLTVFRGQGQGTRPDTSTVNFEPGQTVANSATTAVTGRGTYSVYNHSGPVHLIADLTGYFVTG
ncbi:hypothetical protein [Streptomyces sp. CBMA156]|uniref:hypothetical protein n=1 Tax=Streptomyces sp. CBMA156 TaxID=1930280 RepID=UPI001661A66C|nr:hypothetical protein [Streptomyces sp. CBMA156]MBD0671791.1 hypothetical protein [Streptomyces sp. CBMA156]